MGMIYRGNGEAVGFISGGMVYRGGEVVGFFDADMDGGDAAAAFLLLLSP